MEGAPEADDESACRLTTLGRDGWHQHDEGNLEWQGQLRRGRVRCSFWTEAEHDASALQSADASMEPLVGLQQGWSDAGASDGWRIPKRTRRVLRRRGVSGQGDLRSRCVVGYHAELCSLRAEFLRRWRQDLGSKLDRYADADRQLRPRKFGRISP